MNTLGQTLGNLRGTLGLFHRHAATFAEVDSEFLRNDKCGEKKTSFIKVIDGPVWQFQIGLALQKQQENK